jgi:hypothetical protein
LKGGFSPHGSLASVLRRSSSGLAACRKDNRRRECGPELDRYDDYKTRVKYRLVPASGDKTRIASSPSTRAGGPVDSPGIGLYFSQVHWGTVTFWKLLESIVVVSPRDSYQRLAQRWGLWGRGEYGGLSYHEASPAIGGSPSPRIAFLQANTWSMISPCFRPVRRHALLSRSGRLRSRA